MMLHVKFVRDVLFRVNFDHTCILSIISTQLMNSVLFRISICIGVSIILMRKNYRSSVVQPCINISKNVLIFLNLVESSLAELRTSEPKRFLTNPKIPSFNSLTWVLYFCGARRILFTNSTSFSLSYRILTSFSISRLTLFFTNLVFALENGARTRSKMTT